MLSDVVRVIGVHEVETALGVAHFKKKKEREGAVVKYTNRTTG